MFELFVVQSARMFEAELHTMCPISQRYNKPSMSEFLSFVSENTIRTAAKMYLEN